MATFFRKVNFGGNPEVDVLRIEKVGKHPVLPSGWDKTINSMVVDEGYNVCLYSRPYLQPASDVICFGPGSYGDFRRLARRNTTWSNIVSSFHLRKDCDNRKWTWDDDCFYADPDRTIGSCTDKSSQCYRNRIMNCNESDTPDEHCLNFCLLNQGQCDSMMRKYCQKPENKDKDICSCLNSAAIKYNPLCIDSKCTRHGYATNSMINQSCPDITDCGIYYDIKGTGGNINFTDATLEQRCGQSSQDAPPTSTVPASSEPAASSESASLTETVAPAPSSALVASSIASNDAAGSDMKSNGFSPLKVAIVVAVLTICLVIIYYLTKYMLTSSSNTVPTASTFTPRIT